VGRHKGSHGTGHD
jgi:hypothetical protein